MSHRAQQIVDALVSLIDTQVASKGVKVYAHRRLSLSQDQDELPAISVDFGEDDAQLEDNRDFHSLLDCEITSIVVGYDETDLKTQLLDYRRDSHIAITADRTLGLSFVTRALYAGANEPEYVTDGEMFIGSLTSVWGVAYRMDIDDPGD